MIHVSQSDFFCVDPLRLLFRRFFFLTVELRLTPTVAAGDFVLDAPMTSGRLCVDTDTVSQTGLECLCTDGGGVFELGLVLVLSFV